MKSTPRVAIAAVAAGAVGFIAAMTAPAAADYEPGPSDVVGVGGDTPQFALQFLSDGDVLGDPGYNGAGNSYKLVTFDATADANARQAYAQGSTTASPKLLSPTDVLRAGTVPVQRIASSGSAITALLNDTGTIHTINFVFSASEPTAAQQTQAGTNGWGYLHVVQFATDSIKIATANTTDAPTGLSAAELLGIYNGTYTKWNQLPGNSGGSGNTIVPELPPASSSVNKTFLADLKAANGGTAVTLGSDVVTVEQNDPTAITGNATPADAIVPFSSGRLALWTAGYFHDPTTPFPGNPTALTPGIKLLAGTTPDAAAVYNSPITDYVIYRQSDSTDAPWQPGSTENWVNALFSNSVNTHPFLTSTSAIADIEAAGLTPAYSNLGNVSNG